MTVNETYEMYLETILLLEGEVGNIRISDVATKMNVSKASVNKAIKKLCEKDLIFHEHYGLITFTDEGRKIANATLAKHKLLNNFLCDILKVSKENAENDACLMEHCISEETFKCIELYYQKHR